MTDSEALERGRRAIEAMSDERAGLYVGGFGCILATEVPGYTIRAQVKEDGAPELTIWRNQQVIDWLRRAEAYRRRYPQDGWITAMWETME